MAGRAPLSRCLSFLLLLVTIFINVCAGGEYCTYYEDGSMTTRYCSYDCCDDECCDDDENVALIVWLCIGGGLLVVSIIVIVCCYRRRASRGVVYRQNPGGPTIITSSSTATSGTVMNTTGLPPGGYVNPMAGPPMPMAAHPMPMAAHPMPMAAHPMPMTTHPVQGSCPVDRKPYAPPTAPPPYSAAEGGMSSPTCPDTFGETGEN